MMKELHLSIVSPEKSVFDGEVKIVTLPGTVGSFSILPGHAPIVSSTAFAIASAMASKL
jgi:F-type H+-transporting ATPase subunit epsilon